VNRLGDGGAKHVSEATSCTEKPICNPYSTEFGVGMPFPISLRNFKSLWTGIRYLKPTKRPTADQSAGHERKDHCFAIEPMS
jgi:hypothetical protein